MKQVINAWNGLSRDEQLAVLDKIAMVGANAITLPPKEYLSYHASSEDLMMMIGNNSHWQNFKEYDHYAMVLLLSF